MSEFVPEGWISKQLIDCSVDGISNGVFCDPNKVGSGYKLINVYEMYQGYGIDVNLTRRLQLDEKEFIKNKVSYGDVFFTRSSLKLEGIAYCNINLSYDSDITYDGHLMKIVPNKSLVYPEYLARYCLSDFARKFFISTAKHSTMTTIAQSDIAPLQVLIPPLPEQQKIAAILTSVDKVIEKTQAQINKLKDLKTGMMQELLTRGVGVDGKPHTEFKDSPVGRIPKGWAVVPLEELVKNDKKITYGIVQAGPHYEGGVPYIRVSDMSSRHLTKKGMLLTSPEIARKFERSSVRAGDIVYALRGMIGHVHIVPSELNGANLTQGTARISPSENINTNYLLWAMRSPYVALQNDLEAKGSTFKEVTLASLRQIHIAVPSGREQQCISSSLSSIESRIYTTEDKLNHLKALKKALMQDLLTGKVRVKVDS